MDRDEFIAKVKRRLPDYDSSDDETVTRSIDFCRKHGFSLADAAAWVRMTEEVSPQIAEKTALRRMSEIGSKYKSYRERKKV